MHTPYNAHCVQLWLTQLFELQQLSSNFLSYRYKTPGLNRRQILTFFCLIAKFNYLATGIHALEHFTEVAFVQSTCVKIKCAKTVHKWLLREPPPITYVWHVTNPAQPSPLDLLVNKSSQNICISHYMQCLEKTCINYGDQQM